MDISELNILPVNVDKAKAVMIKVYHLSLNNLTEDTIKEETIKPTDHRTT